jgi:hypothetical protein
MIGSGGAVGRAARSLADSTPSSRLKMIVNQGDGNP